MSPNVEGCSGNEMDGLVTSHDSQLTPGDPGLRELCCLILLILCQ